MGQTPHGWCQVSLGKRQVGGQTHFSGKAGQRAFAPGGSIVIKSKFNRMNDRWQKLNEF
jgi:hypothetical protein